MQIADGLKKTTYFVFPGYALWNHYIKDLTAKIIHSTCKDLRLARIEPALGLAFCNTIILNHTPELTLHLKLTNIKNLAV